MTFDPHPMAVLRPEHAPPTLSDVESRSALLAEAGVDDVYVIAFSREIAAWSPQEFVERVLVDGLHATAVVVGANFRFGARAAGDVATLREEGERHDFEVEGIALDGGPQVWSSTYVRTCLAAGDVEGAAEALGRPYTLAGTWSAVSSGAASWATRRRTSRRTRLAAPADGVYAGWLSPGNPDQPALPAAISVGTNPTFDGERERRVEAYVLDRSDLELYDVRVRDLVRDGRADAVRHGRARRACADVDALLAAMADDVERARAILGVNAPLGQPARRRGPAPPARRSCRPLPGRRRRPRPWRPCRRPGS